VSKLASITFALLEGLLALGQETPSKGEAYSGRASGWLATTGTVQLQSQINRFSTAEDLELSARNLRRSATNGLRMGLAKCTVNRISSRSAAANPMAIALKTAVGSDTVITLITTRNLPFRELWRAQRDVDSPYRFLQVTLRQCGTRSGRIGAGNICVDCHGEHYKFETGETYYIKAVNVPHIKRGRDRPINRSFCRDCKLAAMFSPAEPLSIELRRTQ
jgi:hypothetical protein